MNCSAANKTLISGSDITSDASNIVVTCFIILFMVLGSFGSIITMVAIWTSKALHSVSNLLIFSLCLSDLTSALICSPLWLYRRTWGFKDWKLGSQLCKFYWVSDFTTSYATSLHIVSFAALRYAAVKKPFSMSAISKRDVLIYIGLLWLISIAVAVPLIFYMDAFPQEERGKENMGLSWPSCSIIDNDHCCVDQYNLYMSIVNPILFYFPIVILAVLSLLIMKVLVKRNRWRQHASNFVEMENRFRRVKSDPTQNDKNQNTGNIEANEAQINTRPEPTVNTITCQHHKKARQAIGDARLRLERNIFFQLLLIIFTFVVGYIPVTAYLMWTTATPKCMISYSSDYWFGVASYLSLRISECMNPVMYNLGSCNMRKESLRIVKRVFRCKR